MPTENVIASLMLRSRAVGSIHYSPPSRCVSAAPAVRSTAGVHTVVTAQRDQTAYSSGRRAGYLSLARPQRDGPDSTTVAHAHIQRCGPAAATIAAASAHDDVCAHQRRAHVPARIRAAWHIHIVAHVRRSPRYVHVAVRARHITRLASAHDQPATADALQRRTVDVAHGLRRAQHKTLMNVASSVPMLSLPVLYNVSAPAAALVLLRIHQSTTCSSPWCRCHWMNRLGYAFVYPV
ncbi:hypothetical protein ON010_g9142 [Phytophthora cinnamomi]|nr:hypothetical protein ON010_g9142 [Phytophthora cinnamomi]